MTTRHILREMSRDEGFSLTELLTVTVLLGVILSAAYLAIGAVTSISDQMMAREQAQSQGQIAIERMTREIRQGQKIDDGSGGYVYLGANATNTISFYADVDHNGHLDRITYFVGPGGMLQRKAATTTKVLTPLPTDFGTDGAPTDLVKIDPATPAIFNYYTSASPPLITTDKLAARAIQLNIRAVAKSGPTSATIAFPPAWVMVRSYY